MQPFGGFTEMSRRLSLFAALILILSLVVPVASAQEINTGAEPSSTARYSHRLIVELTSPAVAAMDSPVMDGTAVPTGGRLNLDSPQAQSHAQTIVAEQQAFVAQLGQAIPNASVAQFLDENRRSRQATYQVVMNAVAVDAGRNVDVATLARQLQALPGVRRVYRDYAHEPTLYASLPLINVTAAWNNPAIGGMANAGEGMKLASVDGGIHKDAPMFDGTGYTYPPGYPKGDTRNTNGKIIASRAYFRWWDPPSEGDENPWPGTQGTSHGVSTSSMAAGNQVTASYLGVTTTLSGVAPRAYVMSYRVFYNSITNDGSFYNVEGIAALEDAVRDGADVINNSWGGGPGSLGGEFDALDTALINAARAGVFVSM
jgi:hypothetical protein